MPFEGVSIVKIRLALFAGSVALRVVTWLVLAELSGSDAPNLSLFFDGHIYQLIAQTFPHPYQDIHSLFPQFPKSPTYLTAWFPGYPLIIWTANWAVHDLRMAALVVSWIASGLAVVAFYELARRMTDRPLAAAAIFTFLPPEWLLCGSLAFVEPLFVGLFIATMAFFVAGRRNAAIAVAGLTIVSQKTGILVLPVLFLSIWNGSLKNTVRVFLPYLAALLPLAALQAYLWLVFSDPIINFATHRRVFGGSYFSLPFLSLASGLLEAHSALPGLFWTRKLMTFGSVVFYAGTWAWCWRKRTPEETPLLVWLGVVTAFAVSLAGSWGYYAFARLCVVAAPPALLLWARRTRAPLARFWPALVLLAPLVVLYDAFAALGHLELWSRLWSPRYLALVVHHFAS